MAKSENKSNIANATFWAGGAAILAAGGIAASAIANRRELGAIYNQAYVDALSKGLPNLVFNLGVLIGSEKASKVADQIANSLSHNAVKLAEDKAVGEFVDAVAEIIAAQINIDGEWLKAGMNEAKKPLRDMLKAGRQDRSSFVWHWAKKITSPVHFVATPLLLAAGEVNARASESELNELTKSIKSQIVPIENVENSRSMNPLKAGILGSVCNITFNALSTVAEYSGAAHGHIEAACSNPIDLFEEAINEAIMEKTGNRVDLRDVAKKLGLKDLTSKRYHSCFTGSMEVTVKLKGKVKDIGSMIYADWKDPSFFAELQDKRILY